ncbi:hypothetical protein NA57DRAFT_49296 [Rhizodiscina lignyota]|uniref:Uncharacterized protein n=1 Tax=Rhizodiscina lignyota TaxID=1504668 RepID=A0A9P4I4B0_9PEZI|nr:hypothetical protein NA57DRAFT_49296 [Rhizodiscina lignyota]
MAPVQCYDLVSQLSHTLQDNERQDDSLTQPWRAFWPPSGAADPGIWRNSEFPEVSIWKFDPRQPFDRPWRKWTRTLRAKAEANQYSPQNIGHEITFPANNRRCCEDPYDSNPTHCAVAAKELDVQATTQGMGIVTSSFEYLAPFAESRSEKPYLSRLPSLPGFRRTNISGCDQPTQVYEVSGNEHLFALDTSGFAFVKFSNPILDFADSTVCERYVPCLASWLKSYLNCLDVHVYAYNVRLDNQPRLLTYYIGQDATPKSCSERLQIYLPGKAEILGSKRVRFLKCVSWSLNQCIIWRPLTTPLQNSPLALCDFRTVSPRDLIAADILFPHYLDEAYEVLHSPAHRWFYKQGMKEEDMILFKLDDTAEDVAKLCPHSAFMDPSVPADTPERMSIEVRVIAIG